MPPMDLTIQFQNLLTSLGRVLAEIPQDYQLSFTFETSTVHLTHQRDDSLCANLKLYSLQFVYSDLALYGLFSRSESELIEGRRFNGKHIASLLEIRFT